MGQGWCGLRPQGYTTSARRVALSESRESELHVSVAVAH